MTTPTTNFLPTLKDTLSKC
jgi:hypothetical protein